MIEKQRKQKIRPKDPVYPVVNMYSCPRVSKQRVNNTQIPLLKYRGKIQATDRKVSHDADFVQGSLLRKFKETDGLIYSFKQMAKQIEGINRIKVLICVCMYNESKNAINLTLNGIYENLPNLRAKGMSDGDIGVVLIQDGILKLVQDRVKRTWVKGDNSMIKLYEKMDKEEGKDKCELVERINIILDEMENYNRKGMGDNVKNNRDFPPSIEKNIALVYQNLWRPSKTYFKNEHNPYEPQDIPEKLRVFSCFKHTNGTKLSSHLWFFEGFCRYLKPQFCVLLDVGTKPDPMGIVNLIKGFSVGKNIGGVTGFMSVDSNFPSEEGEQEQTSNCCVNNFFSIERAQEYEYIIAHFLDKNAESALGFLHVLPGAWSAYRYDALIKSEKYEPNLLERSYFKMILNPDIEEKNFQEANMYLAEDRILSLGIYCQMQSQYLLKYIPDAIAYTDPMKDHQNLMNQRRRWINSSFFAFFYVFKNYYFNVMDSEHNFFRKYITLNISMLLALLSTITSYITPALYFFILYSTVLQAGMYSDEEYYAASMQDREKLIFFKSFTQWSALGFSLLYVLVFLVGVGGALTGRQWSKRAHVVSAVLSFYTFALIGLVFYNIQKILQKVEEEKIDYQSFIVMSIFIITIINVGFFVLLLILHVPTHCGFVWKIIANTVSYMSYTGAYSQTMVINSFCNVDDVSWGTKGSVGTGVKKYQVDKVFFVSSWLFYNCLLSFVFIFVDFLMVETGTSASPENGSVMLILIAFWGTVTYFLKMVFAIYYHLKWSTCEKCCMTLMGPNEENRKDLIDRYWKQEKDKIQTGNINFDEVQSKIIQKRK